MKTEENRKAMMQPYTFFISYRRQDTAPIALLLKNEIEKRLQFVRVSVDVEEVKPGDSFPTRLKSLIDKSHATIVLIGKQWMPKVTSSISRKREIDWVIEEVVYSNEAPLLMPKVERFDQRRRIIVPLFADCDPDFRQFPIPANVKFLTNLHAEHIDYGRWPIMIGPLLERLAIKLSLKKRPDADEYPKPSLTKARTQPLPDMELAQTLRYDDFEGWYVDNFGTAEARYIVKTFKFSHFNQAADFMALVSNHCRVLDHHPEWRNVFNHVTVSLTTWDAHRRVTIYDLNLALYMNMAAKAVLKDGRRTIS